MSTSYVQRTELFSQSQLEFSKGGIAAHGGDNVAFRYFFPTVQRVLGGGLYAGDRRMVRAPSRGTRHPNKENIRGVFFDHHTDSTAPVVTFDFQLSIEGMLAAETPRLLRTAQTS